MTPDGEDTLAPEVVALLRSSVDTLEKLELVTAMAREPITNWSLEDLSARVRVPRSELVYAIDQLRAAGILRQVPGTTYKLLYTPTTRELAAACSALRQVYDRQPSAVIRMLRELEMDRSSNSEADVFPIRRSRTDHDDK